MKTKFTWKYALVVLGVLATASLLAQYAGPGQRMSMRPGRRSSRPPRWSRFEPTLD